MNLKEDGILCYNIDTNDSYILEGPLGGDPTQVTYLDQNHFDNTDEKTGVGGDVINSMLTSMVFKGSLNVCQILRNSEGSRVSIPLDETLVNEKLHFNEIIADLVLFTLLTENVDRCVCLQTDVRNKIGTAIQSHNCTIYPSGTYSMYDIWSTFPNISEENIETLTYKTIFEILEDLETIHDQIQALMFSEEGGESLFILRIQDRAIKIFDQYDYAEGKMLFRKQYLMANSLEDINKYDDEISKFYSNFMLSLRKIKVFFNQENISETLS